MPPTAMQKLGEVHEIASRAGLATAGSEAAVTVQAIPLQLSAKDSISLGAPPSGGWFSAAPTAMQKLTDVHDTPVRLDSTRPSAPAVGWVVHAALDAADDAGNPPESNSAARMPRPDNRVQLAVNRIVPPPLIGPLTPSEVDRCRQRRRGWPFEDARRRRFGFA